MGGDTSRPLPSLQRDNYMSISTFSYDTMLLYYMPQPEVEAVHNAILSTWRKGIRSEEFICEADKANPHYRNSLKLKLNGRPWGKMLKEDEAVDVRYMIAGVLETLHSLGWRIIISSDMTESVDMSFWLFHQQQPNTTDKPLFSVALSSKSHLRISDAPEAVVADIKTICEDWGNAGVELVRDGRTSKIHLKGTPWSPSSKEETIQASFLVTDIIKKMAEQKFSLYCNINVKSTADTLYFRDDSELEEVEQDLASIRVQTPDLLYFIHFPDSVFDAALKVIADYWPKGVQSTKYVGKIVKLNGRPFLRGLNKIPQISLNDQDRVYTRRLITKLLQELAACGYTVQAGLNLSRCHLYKTNFLFRKVGPIQGSFMCLSANWEDTVQLVCAPEEVCEKMAEVVKIWEKGEHSHSRLTPFDGCSWQTKLRGYPWAAVDWYQTCDGIYGQALLVHMLVAVMDLGWELLCSGDMLFKYEGQKYQGDYPADNHSWWFFKEQQNL